MVVFCDADLDLHPKQLDRFFKIMKEENADVVIGSKRHPESRVDYPWYRRTLSSVYFFMIKIMFGLPIRDTQTGLKLFKRDVLEKVFPVILVKRYAYDLEVLALAHHLGFKVTEAPVELNFQRAYWGRIGFKCMLDMCLDTLAVFYRLNIIRYYDKCISRKSQ